MILHPVLASISTSVSHGAQSCPQPSALVSLWLLSGQFPFACVPREPALTGSPGVALTIWLGSLPPSTQNSILFPAQLLPSAWTVSIVDSSCGIPDLTSACLPLVIRRAFLPFTYSIAWPLLAMARIARVYVSLCLYLSVRACVRVHVCGP